MKDRKKFEKTEDYARFREYKKLKKLKHIKDYYKLEKSPKFSLFKEIDESKELKNYETLKKFIASDEFKKVEKYMKDKKKFEKTDEFTQFLEYKKLKKSKQIKEFYKLKKSKEFNELKEWKISFEDNFDSKKLDTEKWMTKYYWGQELMNAGYSLSTDEQSFTDEKNFEISDSILKILTKKEKAKGFVWDLNMGFFMKDFDYTSGLLSTGKSFRQKHGRFSAKIKLNSEKGVYHAFWMVSDKLLPQIDILKLSAQGKLQMSKHSENSSKDQNKKQTFSLGGSKFCNKYFIYTLEWNQDEIIWKINNKIVGRLNSDIPDIPMYLMLNSGIEKSSNPAKLPVCMDVDWVRCYLKVNENEK